MKPPPAPTRTTSWKSSSASKAFAEDAEFRALSNAWRAMALERKYMNNFSWLGRPLIQLPMDAMAMQEVIWAVQPDLIIETGVAHAAR